jgi:hypothetical protein
MRAFQVACIDRIKGLTGLPKLLDMAPERKGLINARLVQANIFPALYPPLSVPRCFPVPY